jgi:hypothetical protein
MVQLNNLHGHDPRHTVAGQLRETRIFEVTISDILWRSKPSINQHYARSRLLERRNAMEPIRVSNFYFDPTRFEAIWTRAVAKAAIRESRCVAFS